MINHVVFRGNLVRDPELKHTAGGVAVVSFTLANNRRYQKKGSEEWLDDATFLDCEAWEKAAERIAEKFGKGDCMLVEGQLKEDRWVDKATETNRSKIKLRVLSHEAAPMPKKAASEDEEPADEPAPKSKAPAKSAKPAKKAPPPQDDGEDDDVPF